MPHSRRTLKLFPVNKLSNCACRRLTSMRTCISSGKTKMTSRIRNGEASLQIATFSHSFRCFATLANLFTYSQGFSSRLTQFCEFVTAKTYPLGPRKFREFLAHFRAAAVLFLTCRPFTCISQSKYTGQRVCCMTNYYLNNGGRYDTSGIKSRSLYLTGPLR